MNAVPSAASRAGREANDPDAEKEDDDTKRGWELLHSNAIEVIIFKSGSVITYTWPFAQYAATAECGPHKSGVGVGAKCRVGIFERRGSCSRMD